MASAVQEGYHQDMAEGEATDSGRTGGEPTEATEPDGFRDRRSYKYSSLPIIRPGRQDSNAPDALLKVYEETCANWRMLTEVRFKLLGLLPVVAAVALVAIVSDGGPFPEVATAPRVGLGGFGLSITVGLFLYEKRNNELYNDLISRGRRAEYELGVHSGVFLGRPEPHPGMRGRIVRHGTATALVYWTVVVAWIAAILHVLIAGP